MMTLVKDDATETADDGTLSGAGAASPSIPNSSRVERRRGLRIAQNRPVKVFEPSSSRYFPGQTEDVSATGLKIELPVSAPVIPGKTINIHVGLATIGQSLANRRQMIPARIVWIDRTHQLERTPATMTAGVEFLVGISAHRDAA